jgi:uncharacterized membrane protein
VQETPDATAERFGGPASARREAWVRRLPWIGLALGIVDAVFLALVLWLNPEQAKWLAASIPVLFAAGKEAAIPAGIALGAHAGLMATTMILTDIAATLVIYPLVHLAMDSLERRKGFFGRMLRGAVRRAEKQRRIVDRYGVLGLYFFAIIPFAFNGPPQCAAIGRLAGLKARQVLPVILLAIVTTSIAWSLLYFAGFRLLEQVNPWIPLGISLSIMTVMVSIGIVGAILDKGDGES